MEIEITLQKEDWRRFQSHIQKRMLEQQQGWPGGFWGKTVVWAFMLALFMTAFQQFSLAHGTVYVNGLYFDSRHAGFKA